MSTGPQDDETVKYRRVVFRRIIDLSRLVSSGPQDDGLSNRGGKWCPGWFKCQVELDSDIQDERNVR